MKEFFKRGFQKIQYWFWRLIYMKCVEQVNAELKSLGKESLIKDKEFQETIAYLCAKGYDYRVIARVIIDRHLREEAALKKKLSDKEKSFLICELDESNKPSHEIENNVRSNQGGTRSPSV